MTGEMHMAGAIISGYGIYHIGNQLGIPISPIYFIGGSWLGGLLPDIDHPESMLGRRIRPVSTILMGTVKHRTFTHSLLFAAIIGFTVSLFNISLGTGLLIGILSHILLDLLSPNTNGVAFLYPFRKDRIKPWQTANPTDGRGQAAGGGHPAGDLKKEKRRRKRTIGS